MSVCERMWVVGDIDANGVVCGSWLWLYSSNQGGHY